MTPEDHMKRTRVLEAIAVLEKNKIPASSDNIMLQMGDGGMHLIFYFLIYFTASVNSQSSSMNN